MTTFQLLNCLLESTTVHAWKQMVNECHSNVLGFIEDDKKKPFSLMMTTSGVENSTVYISASALLLQMAPLSILTEANLKD